MAQLRDIASLLLNYTIAHIPREVSEGMAGVWVHIAVLYCLSCITMLAILYVRACAKGCWGDTGTDIVQVEGNTTPVSVTCTAKCLNRCCANARVRQRGGVRGGPPPLQRGNPSRAPHLDRGEEVAGTETDTETVFGEEGDLHKTGDEGSRLPRQESKSVAPPSPIRPTITTRAKTKKESKASDSSNTGEKYAGVGLQRIKVSEHYVQ